MSAGAAAPKPSRRGRCANRKICRALLPRFGSNALITDDATMTAALQTYHARMQRVLAYIDQHLDDELDLDTLSGVAATSKFHFHRQFTATFGLSVQRYIQLARMKQASYRLASQPDQRVTDIAMDAGYDAPDAFARAFRQRFGQSPSAFRRSPAWGPWMAGLKPFDDARSKLMTRTFTADEVTLREVQPTRVAIMEHRGDPAALGATIQRFIAWRKANGLHPSRSPTFNIWRSEGRPDPADEYHIDLCVGIDGPIAVPDERIKMGEIPGGRCAVLRVVGDTENLEPAALFLYRDWLPASGEEPQDFPLYCQRLALFPDVPQHETVADLFLPLRG